MIQHPVEQSPLETDITASLFAFNPFMSENFLLFSQKLAIKRRIFQKITGIR